jgi:uncharacterized protein YcbK (DUF882 family)
MNKRQLFKGVFATIAVSGSAAALFHLSPLIDHNELPDDARIEMEEDLAMAKGDRLVRTPSPVSTPTIADKGPRLPSFAREETLNVPLPQPKPVLPEVQPTTSPIANPPIPVPRPKDLTQPSQSDARTAKPPQAPAKIPKVQQAEAEKPSRQKLEAPSIFRRAASSIIFFHTHTGEKLNLDFKDVDRRAVDYFMRDFRRNEQKHIDERLITRFGRVVQILREGGADLDRMDLISGYRSAATNAMLQNTRGGQASNSQHIYGRAMDIRAGGVRLSVLHKAACAVARAEGFGGVGYYPKQTSNFVHIDVASLRFWGI